MPIDFSKFDSVPPGRDTTEVKPLDDYLIDLARDYPPVDFLLRYNGIGCIPAGDLQVVTGKQKTGKTFACLSMEVAMLRGDFMGFEAIKDEIRVLHIDTEQSPGNVVKKAKTAHSLCGWSESVGNERFNILSLRECSYEDRLRITLEAIERFKPHFVFIDGIRDLCKDFNDIGESAKLVNELMRVSSQYRCAVMSVLHENKADGNMRGHLGSELANKCSEVYQVSKKDDTVQVEQTVCRNMPIEKWAFRIDDKGGPVPDFADTRSQLQAKRDTTLESIFARKKSHSYSGLVADYKEFGACSDRTAERHIAAALKEGVIRKSDKENYYFADFGTDDEDNIYA